MGFGEIDLLTMSVEISQGHDVFGLPFEKLEQMQDLADCLVLLRRDFEVVDSLVLAAILYPFAGGHPSPLRV